MEIAHVPVMLEEVLRMLKVKKSGVYVDGTVGLGGHAEGILKSVEGGCTLIGIDKDEEALKIAKERLKGFDVHLIRDRFPNTDAVISNLGYREVDGILLDLGVSTLQLKSEGRGFSFLKDEPLDMRMDNRQTLTALRIISGYPEKDLAHILWQYGEERFSRKIARAIVNVREQKPIRTCRELSQIIEKAIGRKGRIHPATKTFQALRIEVNKELTELSMAINTGINILKSGGRFCILSYHSLEDRIVKHSFKELAHKGMVSIITKKPLIPKKEEQRLNPSSRSAKLRTVEKL
ncbi:MAG: 16S rRNA (cytosine(1402)-N(4))-methyltransferase RsmH [Thermodesulfovibrionia bacterium]|nr:16S rRNA (cytosine(1402)-N(4))-methyltransferase RsmH [Thermodesulfovibrionia bacterium]